MPEKKIKYNYGHVEQFFKENVEQKVDEGKVFFKTILKNVLKSCKQPFDVIKVDFAKIIDDLRKKTGSVTMFKKIRDTKNCCQYQILTTGNVKEKTKLREATSSTR